MIDKSGVSLLLQSTVYFDWTWNAIAAFFILCVCECSGINSDYHQPKAWTFVWSRWVRNSIAADTLLVLYLQKVYSFCVSHVQNYRHVTLMQLHNSVWSRDDLCESDTSCFSLEAT